MNRAPKTVALSLSAVILLSLLSSILVPVLTDSRALAGFTDTPTPADSPVPPEDTPVPPTDTAAPPVDTPVPNTDTPAPPADTSTPKPKKPRDDDSEPPVQAAPSETPTATTVTPTPTLSVTPGTPITGRTLSVTSLLWVGLIVGIVGVSLLLSRRR